MLKGRRSLGFFGLSLVLFLGLTFMVSGQAKAADSWPERSIVMIVPFDPGGATDQIGRALKGFMEEKLGVPIAVQNMPGGATSVGNQYVFDAPHDGYTILVEPTDITSIAVMGQSKLTWKDWEFMGVAAAVPNAFVVHPDSPIKTVKDLAEALKKEQLTCSVAASGCAVDQGHRPVRGFDRRENRRRWCPWAAAVPPRCPRLKKRSISPLAVSPRPRTWCPGKSFVPWPTGARKT